MITSSILFSAVFAILLGSWLWVFLTHRTRIPTAAVLIGSLAAPVLVSGVMATSTGSFGDLRIALEGLRFHLESTSDRPLRVGGAGDEDHLVVRDLPPGFLRFSFEEGGVVARLFPDPTGRRFAVARVGGKRPFHNAVAIDEALEVGLAGEEAGGLRFDPQTPSFEPASGGATFRALPRRTTAFLGLDLPVGRGRPPETQIYPLRFYGTPDSAAGGEPLVGPAGPVGAFVCRDGGIWRRQLYFVTTDETVAATPVGGEPLAFEPVVLRLEDGGPTEHLALFRVDYHDDRGDAERWSRTQERRSFKVRYVDGQLDLILDTPFHLPVRRRHLEKLEEVVRHRSVTESPPTFTLAGNSFEESLTEGQLLLNFPILGRAFGPELFSRIAVEEGQDSFEVTTHTGNRSYALGEAFPVGDHDAVLLRISRFGMPWGALAVVWVAALAALLTGLEQRRHFMPWMLLSGTELLLAVRLLIGYEGAIIDPAASSAAWRSLAAFVMIPFFLQTAYAFYKKTWRGLAAVLVAHWLVVAALLAVIFNALHASPWTWVGTVVFLSLGPWVAALGLGWLDRLPLDAETPATPFSWKPVLWLAGLLFAFRLITLLSFGWKERMSLGPLVLAVSVYYTPLVLLVFALLWRRIRGGGWRFIVLFGVLLGGLGFLLPRLARDWGAALIFPLPIMALYALSALERPGALRQPRALLAIPFIAIFLFYSVLPLVPALGLARRIAGWTPADVAAAAESSAAAEDLIEQRVAKGHNKLRLWKIIAPKSLREIGTNDAESLLVVMENLRAYASRGPLGEGYLNGPLAPTLRATHLDDNVSAVHVLGAFGWLGGGVLLALLGLWAWLPFAALMRASPLCEITPRMAFGLLLVWTFFAAGAYMFLANIELLLFTGKNVYFIAASSRSDAVESTLLVLLALWAFTSRPTSAPSAPPPSAPGPVLPPMPGELT